MKNENTPLVNHLLNTAFVFEIKNASPAKKLKIAAEDVQTTHLLLLASLKKNFANL